MDESTLRIHGNDPHQIRHRIFQKINMAEDSTRGPLASIAAFFCATRIAIVIPGLHLRLHITVIVVVFLFSSNYLVAQFQSPWVYSSVNTWETLSTDGDGGCFTYISHDPNWVKSPAKQLYSCSTCWCHK